MMDKYYVKWGKHRIVIMAANPITACIKVMQKVLGQSEPTNGTVIPAFFIISQRGFDSEPDIIWQTSEIVKIKYAANQAEEDLGYED